MAKIERYLVRALFAPALFLSATASALGQTPPLFGNGSCGDVPSTYSGTDPCLHLYIVSPPAAALIMHNEPNCKLMTQTQVYCSHQLSRNYGQVEARDHPNYVGPTQAAAQPMQYAIPSAPPPVGVLALQHAQAELLWNQAAALCNQERYREAIPLLYQGALLGDARARATLAIRYQNGEGIGADDRSAAYWFGLAAAQGHRASEYGLGGMYLEGEGGLPKDLQKGSELMMKSANQGYDKAQLALGILYEFGEGVSRDRTKAIALIRQSGLADDIAGVLADPKTPASFANEDAFGAYLTSLRNAQLAASWAQARSTRATGPTFGPSIDQRRLRENPPSPPVAPWIQQY